LAKVEVQIHWANKHSASKRQSAQSTIIVNYIFTLAHKFHKPIVFMDI